METGMIGICVINPDSKKSDNNLHLANNRADELSIKTNIRLK